MIQIRQAEIEDIDALNKVSAYLGYSPPTNKLAAERLEEILGSNQDYIWVCLKEEKIIGWLHLFIALRIASPKFAEIGGLVVEESSRREGLGRKLVKEAIMFSKNNNLTLRVRCNSKRQVANGFYNNLGFLNKKNQCVHELSHS